MAWLAEDPRNPRKDGSIPIVVGWRDGTGRLCRRTFRDEGKAEKFRVLQDADEQRRAQGDVVGGRQTFEVAARAWLNAPRRRSLKPQVRAEYERILGLGTKASATADYYKALRTRRLDQITPQVIEQLVSKLVVAGKNPNTIRNILAPARATFRYAVKQRWIATSPVDAITMPEDRPDGEDAFEPVFLAPGEVDRLAETMSDEPDGLIVRFLAGTGLRVGELTALRVCDINLLRRSVRVERTLTRQAGAWVVGTPKTRRSKRQVPILDDRLRDDLEEYLTQQHARADDPEALLFCGRQTGGKRGVRPLDWDKPWHSGAFLDWRFRPALKAAKLPVKMRLHDLRHTAAMTWIDADHEIAKVSRWMGHGDSSITERIYMRASREEDFCGDVLRHRAGVEIDARGRKLETGRAVGD